MPDLWSTQIGLVERHWKEKPRKDVIAALIALRTNMMECQHCYEEYTALREQGDVDYLWRIECAKAQKAGLVIRDHPQREWLRSLNRLAYEVLRLDSLFVDLQSRRAHKHRKVSGF